MNLQIPHHTDWLLWLLLASFILMLSARLYNRRRFNAFAILPFHANRREMETTFNPVPGRGLFDLGLSLLAPVMLSVSCFLILHPYHGYPPFLGDWRLFLRLFFVLLIFFIFKNFVGLLVGWVFNKSDEIALSQNVGLAYRTWAAIILMPICVLAVFFAPAFPVLYYVLLFSLCIAYYFGVQFAAIRIWNITAPPYYKIFYLCALEITPLIFLIGWLVSLYR